ncbi:helix-turn-helix transcriptional regulator [Gracilimonas sp.]|uniref:helix-turn-helix transcriptional regulator n=1 Tax=Gracilimonas sp. TaxID=1974203 RepID=UPI0032EAB5E9
MKNRSAPKIYLNHNPNTPFIKDFWIYTPSGEKSDFYNVYPDGYSDIIFKIAKVQNRLYISKPRIMGLLTKPKSFSGHGTEIIAGIRITPSSAYHYFDVKEEANINDISIEFTKGTQSEVSIPVLNNSIESTVLIFLKNFTLKHLYKDKDPIPINYAIDLILKKSGNIDIKKLSSQTGYSLRHLERKFQAVIGIDPKKYASIVRFRKALYMVKNTNLSLLEIAFSTGYYDHPHLTKEIKNHSFHTPSKIRTENVEYLQSLNLDLKLCSG